MTLELILPDGRRVVADRPSPAVRAALQRVSGALATGRRPKRADARTVRLWLVGQDERHSGRPSEVGT